MNRESSFDRFSDIDERFLREAETARPSRLSRVLTVAACVAVMAVTLSFATGLWKIDVPVEKAPHLCPTLDGEFAIGAPILKQLTYRDTRYAFLSTETVNEKALGEKLGAIASDVPCEDCASYFDTFRSEDDNGTLYAVKGIDTAYMLWLVRDDGVELYAAKDMGVCRVGADLFSTRLHLQELLQSVRFQSAAAMQQSSTHFVTLPSQNDALITFLEALSDSRAAEVSDTASEKLLYQLQFRLQNGAHLHILLYEGGYVRWNDHAFVMDAEPFDTLIATMDLLR
ncbi:MAG: hypothetical protein IJB27_06970 [Clostridia bacterium]|nr:hypothetical protein [Clostridia bacterium]